MSAAFSIRGLRTRVALVAVLAAISILSLTLLSVRAALVAGAEQRSDTELALLASSALRRQHGANHFRRFDETLLLVSGGEATRFALRVEDDGGLELYRSANWPAEWTPDELPIAGSLLPRPTPGPKEVDAELLLAQREPTFGNARAGAKPWRVMASGNERRRLWLAMEASPFLDALDAELARVAAIVLPALALICAGVWWLAARALDPLSRLSTEIGAFDARNLDRRVAADGLAPELLPLAGAFNHALDRLERSFTQASRFSADASHELRTPLTLLQLQVEESLRKAPEGSDWQVQSERLLQDIAGLRSIIDKLLLLAQADSGRLHLNFTPVDFSALCEELMEDLRLLAPDREIRTSVSNVGAVSLDAVLVRRLLQNLAGNAARHCPPGGWIELQAERVGDTVRLRIANSGNGIPQEEAKRLFERFYRGSDARAASGTGAGLGLALSREIARAHGGELRLAEPTPATFELTLPAGAPLSDQNAPR